MSGGGRASGRAGRSSARAGGGMATLKGSEKQIAWAKDIRATTNAALDDVIASSKNPATIARAGENAAKQAAAAAERVRHVINSTESSRALVEAFGGDLSGKTGQQATQSVLLAINRYARRDWPAEWEETGELYKRLKKAWTGK